MSMMALEYTVLQEVGQVAKGVTFVASGVAAGTGRAALPKGVALVAAAAISGAEAKQIVRGTTHVAAAALSGAEDRQVARAITFVAASSLSVAQDSEDPKGATFVAQGFARVTEVKNVVRGITHVYGSTLSGAENKLLAKGTTHVTQASLSGAKIMRPSKGATFIAGAAYSVAEVKNTRRGTTHIANARYSGAVVVPNRGIFTFFVFIVPAPASLTFAKGITLRAGGSYSGVKFTPFSAHFATFIATAKTSGAKRAASPGPWSAVRTFDLVGQPAKGITFVAGGSISGVRTILKVHNTTVIATASLSGGKRVQLPEGVMLAAAFSTSGDALGVFTFPEVITVAAAGSLSAFRALVYSKTTLSSLAALLGLTKQHSAAKGTLVRMGSAFSGMAQFDSLFAKISTMATEHLFSQSKTAVMTKSVAVSLEPSLSVSEVKNIIRPFLVQSAFALSDEKSAVESHGVTVSAGLSLGGNFDAAVPVSVVFQMQPSIPSVTYNVPLRYFFFDCVFTASGVLEGGASSLLRRQATVRVGFVYRGSKIIAGDIGRGVTFKFGAVYLGATSYLFMIIATHPHYLQAAGREKALLLEAGMPEAPLLISASMED